MEEESVTDANTVNADTFSHVYTAYIKIKKKIFTIDKLDKSDELVDAVKNLTIKDVEYYESSTATANDAQDDLTQNLETVTYTSNGKFGQKILSYWTISVLPSPMNSEIDQFISEILLTTQIILMPTTKDIVADAALGGMWMSRTPRRVSRTGVDRTNPGDIGNAIGIVEPTSPVLIGIIGTAPPCGLNVRQEFGDKRKSTPPGLDRQSQKLDVVVDRKLPNNIDSTSIFSKVIGDKLSGGSIQDLYTRCCMNFAADTANIQTPQFLDLGILTINALY